MNYQPDWHVINSNFGLIAKGLGVTFQISLLAEALALAIGLVMGVMRVQKLFVLRAISRTYVEFFRSVPILVLLLWLYFGLTILFNVDLNAFTAGVLGLGLFYGAFLAEVFRAGVEAVPAGQREAALTLGLTRWQTLKDVVLPQAVRIVVPPLANSYIGMLKDATLVSVLGVVELLRAGQLIVARTFRPFEVFTFIALLYLALTILFSTFVGLYERRNPVH